MNKEVFASRVRKMLTDKGWTQTRLATELGITTPVLCHILNTHHNTDIDTLTKIADMFDVSIDWLVGRDYYLDAHHIRTINQYGRDISHHGGKQAESEMWRLMS